MEQSQETDRQKELRRKIVEIQKDSSLDPATKAKKIQELMVSSYKPSAPKEDDTAKNKELNTSVSYNNEANNIFGCKHYRRNCKMKAFCCGQLFPCRLCHDEHVTDHKISRYATKEMMCMFCQKIQPVAPECSECNKSMSRYFCSVCKFWDDMPDKDIFHCSKCNMCRIGKADDYFHCDICNMCLSKKLEHNTHIENTLNADCPICGTDMFTSTKSLYFLEKCNHPMHLSCFKRYVQQYDTCPVCSKSMFDMTQQWAHMDQVISNCKMPEEFKNTTCNILCNECNAKSTVPYHWMGHKCPSCNAYNTAILSHGALPSLTTSQVIQQHQEFNNNVQQFIVTSNANNTEAQLTLGGDNEESGEDSEFEDPMDSDADEESEGEVPVHIVGDEETSESHSSQPQN
jgi:hypothetical protein